MRATVTRVCGIVAISRVLLCLSCLWSLGQSQSGMSEYAEEDKAVDELIVNAANSTNEFEFFYDETQQLLKVEYDIVFSMDEWKDINKPDSRRKKRTAAVAIGSRGAKRWTHAKIPYEYSANDFTDKEKTIVEAAMQEWTEHTCLKFQKDGEAENRLLIKNAGGCFSRIGMVGGRQALALGKNCRFKGVVLHEMGHTIGLHHEQTRPDRDQHVTIVTENIPEPMKFNFQKFTWDILKDLGIPYDYSSIMHYGKNAFSMNGKTTIVTLDPNMQDTIGQKKGLSFRDIKTVNIMYDCKRAQTTCTKTDTDCPGEGYVGKDCQCWCPGTPVQLCTRGGTDKDGGGEAIAKKKEKTKVVEKDCEDQHRTCSYWSSIGECSRNPNYMLVYCKLSCKTCGGNNAKTNTEKKEKTVRTKTSCRDLHGSCTSSAARGFCRSAYYMTYMSTNCKKSCGKCSTAASTAGYHHPGVVSPLCRDLNYQCASWSTRGECRRNPVYMNVQCRKSCGKCGGGGVAYHSGYMMGPHTPCNDQSGNCRYWASIGECFRNQVYMTGACRKSCGRC